MKKAVLVAISLFLLTSVANAMTPGEKAYCLVTENYTVQNNDTLDSITRRYIVKNTYGKREFHEFRDGIIELNYDIFKQRDIRKGDNLVITYWIPNEDTKDEGTN